MNRRGFLARLVTVLTAALGLRQSTPLRSKHFGTIVADDLASEPIGEEAFNEFLEMAMRYGSTKKYLVIPENSPVMEYLDSIDGAPEVLHPL